MSRNAAAQQEFRKMEFGEGVVGGAELILTGIFAVQWCGEGR
jgi:hypothetical protein